MSKHPNELPPAPLSLERKPENEHQGTKKKNLTPVNLHPRSSDQITVIAMPNCVAGLENESSKLAQAHTHKTVQVGCKTQKFMLYFHVAFRY